ncbi:hypothetical protein ABZT06_36090 [Streptomyces sp. NPDC005483]|uniref:hypothetical protein n=1 Tax=Streptomyces sp. NPDC005483 TaxID=3154882 RepID=UPI0033B93943
MAHTRRAHPKERPDLKAQALALALAQMVAGLPLAAWGLRHRSGGWLAAGALLLAHGVLGLSYGLTHPRD